MRCRVRARKDMLSLPQTLQMQGDPESLRDLSQGLSADYWWKQVNPRQEPEIRSLSGKKSAGMGVQGLFWKGIKIIAVALGSCILGPRTWARQFCEVYCCSKKPLPLVQLALPRLGKELGFLGLQPRS